jgi:alpha-L-fucosidase
MSQSGSTQRIPAVWLGLAVCLLAAPSIAQVDDEGLEDGQAPQGIRDSAVDRANAEALAQLKGPKDHLRANEQDVDKWREMKFGLFIHWGPISLIGKPIGWSRGGERRGWHGSGPVPVEIYDNLYKRFDPVKFNADQWVQMAQAAGMKYMVFVCKHHDGFCMFDSKLTDYKITNTPFKRDIFGELAAACHEAGLKLGFYYSLPDWYHPDYRTENHQRYIEYMHGQVRELCSNYGKIDIVWWDGLGGSAKDWDMPNLVRMIRKLQPHVIINSRGGLPGDHQTTEQMIGKPEFNRPWEANMTLGTRWAWIPNDKIKPLRQCIQTLVRIVGGDGNYLLDVGPMADGRIEPGQIARLKEMGQWLHSYGDSIYATRGGPFIPGSWGASTRKGNTIYLHVMSWPEDAIVLPPIAHRIIESTVLTGGTVNVKQTEKAIEVSAPKAQRRELDTIIVLELDGPASDIAPLPLPFSSLTADKKGRSASNTLKSPPPHHDPDRAVDDNMFTRWATDAGTTQAWLEVDLGQPTTFNRARISEEFDRVQEFELQYKAGNEWTTFAQGTSIGSAYSSVFEPVTARYVRLNILKATEGPTIWEFRLFAPKK